MHTCAPRTATCRREGAVAYGRQGQPCGGFDGGLGCRPVLCRAAARLRVRHCREGSLGHAARVSRAWRARCMSCALRGACGAFVHQSQEPMRRIRLPGSPVPATRALHAIRCTVRSCRTRDGQRARQARSLPVCCRLHGACCALRGVRLWTRSERPPCRWRCRCGACRSARRGCSSARRAGCRTRAAVETAAPSPGSRAPLRHAVMRQPKSTGNLYQIDPTAGRTQEGALRHRSAASQSVSATRK